MSRVYCLNYLACKRYIDDNELSCTALTSSAIRATKSNENLEVVLERECFIDKFQEKERVKAVKIKYHREQLMILEYHREQLMILEQQ